MIEGQIYDFTRLVPGMEVAGPAVIHTPITTIALHGGQRGRVDCWRNVVVTFDA
jgi:N-methylhydantoinase A